tara:strand:+ start:2297 stop:2560 length:264 start_codon:yes stop_codon:yes gene_type:complete
MIKIFDILFFILITIFILSTYKYYVSNKNINVKKYNRNNIEQIINTKISNLPILKNDTNSVIEYNDGFSNEIKSDEPRSFWNLLKSE